MKRNDFLKTCGAGVCGCGLLGLLAPLSSRAEGKDGQTTTASADFCNCTLGWQQAVYSAVVGKPVTAEIEETVLRGGSRCSFRIVVQG